MSAQAAPTDTSAVLRCGDMSRSLEPVITSYPPGMTTRPTRFIRQAEALLAAAS